jgi:hypothetical protein
MLYGNSHAGLEPALEGSHQGYPITTQAVLQTYILVDLQYLNPFWQQQQQKSIKL